MTERWVALRSLGSSIWSTYPGLAQGNQTQKRLMKEPDATSLIAANGWPLPANIMLILSSVPELIVKELLKAHHPLLFSCSVVSDSLGPHGLQHARLPCPSLSLGVWLNSYPLSRWCHPTLSSSDVPFSPCPQSFPASGAFPKKRYWNKLFNLWRCTVCPSVHCITCIRPDLLPSLSASHSAQRLPPPSLGDSLL